MNTASVLEQVLSSILVAILLGVWEVLRRQYQKRKERAQQPPAIAPAPAAPPQPALPIAPADASVQPAASAAVPPAATAPTAAPPAASPSAAATPAAAAAPAAAPLTTGDFVSGCLTGVWIFIRIVLSPLLGFVFAAVTSGMLVAFDYPYSTEMGSTTMIVLVLVFTIVNWAVLTFFGMLARMIFQTLTRPAPPA